MDNANLIERLKKAADVTEDQALAEIFGMSKASFSYAKKNCSFSISSIAEFAKKFDCDLNWLITGKSKESKLETAERMLLTAFKDLDDNQKMQAVTFVGNLASGTIPHNAPQSISLVQSGKGNVQANIK